jgi:hypothetical protein
MKIFQLIKLALFTAILSTIVIVAGFIFLSSQRLVSTSPLRDNELILGEPTKIKNTEKILLEEKSTSSPKVAFEEKSNSQQTILATTTPEEIINATTSKKLIIKNVPFTSQAPFAEWNDPRQQDGCEEAASLMAVSWARGESFTPEEAKSVIIAAAEYEKEQYGEFRDTSAHDTAERIIKGYFEYNNYQVKQIKEAEEIIRELAAGNILITPMDGRALNNPYYTPPGPERHMLVIIGYDPNTKEFITNDNGTRHGESYRYNQAVFFSAIRDYSSGYHIPIKEIRKIMIVIKPEAD